jgi:hypothetical protein
VAEFPDLIFLEGSIMPRKIRWRERPCEICGAMITTNGLGREAHLNFCRTATPEQRATALAKRNEVLRTKEGN